VRIFIILNCDIFTAYKLAMLKFFLIEVNLNEIILTYYFELKCIIFMAYLHKYFWTQMNKNMKCAIHHVEFE